MSTERTVPSVRMFFPLGPQYFVSVTIPVASSLGPTDVPHDVLVVQFKCCEYGVKVVYTGESTSLTVSKELEMMESSECMEKIS